MANIVFTYNVLTNHHVLLLPAGSIPRRTTQAIAGKAHTRLRWMFARIQGVATSAESNYATVATTPKTGAKTSKVVCDLTEIA